MPPDSFNLACQFMTRHMRKPNVIKMSNPGVPVASADTVGSHLDDN
jgi:hypothetical protein